MFLLCDIWASYINSSETTEGQPMSIEETVEYTRRASISTDVDSHIIYYDDGSFTGLSSSPSVNKEDDYTVFRLLLSNTGFIRFRLTKKAAS